MDDQRAVSTAISHVLTLGITAVLISGLVVGTSGFIETERDDTARQELTVVGERMAGELEQLDDLVENSDDTARVRTNHPRSIAGSAYTVTLTADSGRCDGDAPCLVLSVESAAARTVVPVNVGNGVTESTVSGGQFVFAYDSTDGLHVEPRGDI